MRGMRGPVRVRAKGDRLSDRDAAASGMMEDSPALASQPSPMTGRYDSNSLRSLDLPCVSLLPAMHGVQVKGNVHRKEEAPVTLRTLEILALALAPGATRG